MIKDWIMLLETLLEWEAWPNGPKMMKCDVPKCDVQNGKVPKEQEKQRSRSTSPQVNARMQWFGQTFCTAVVGISVQLIGLLSISSDKKLALWQFLRSSGVAKGQVASHLRPSEHI